MSARNPLEDGVKLTNWSDIMNAFDWHSSPVDWCEPNYVVSRHISEFFNTASSLLFIIVPWFSIHVFRDYAKFDPKIYAFPVIIILIGLGSMYFHWTLSLAGQLIDEWSILAVFLAGALLWTPNIAKSEHFIRNPRSFDLLVGSVGFSLCVLGVVAPRINMFVLWAMVSYIMWHLHRCYKAVDSELARSMHFLLMRSFIILFLALVSWISDQVFCPFWLKIGFPYLHAIWHALVFHATYGGAIAFSFFRAALDCKDHFVELRYFPENYRWVGMPYVKLTSSASHLPSSNDRRGVVTRSMGNDNGHHKTSLKKVNRSS